MRRRRFLGRIGAATGVGLPVAGCLGLTSGAQDYDVGMTAEAFRPRELTVEVGESVVWRNTSTRAHTVTAYDSGIPSDAGYFATGGFDSETAAREGWRENEGGLTSGEEYTHAFEVPGEFRYFCIPHERAGMIGIVRVEE